METAKEFKEGKHNIRWISSYFLDRVEVKKFEKVKVSPSFQKLPRYMTDSEIESELKPGICTLGDVLSVLDSDNSEFKDGYWNIFYLPACVVRVGWHGSDWGVSAWGRDDCRWVADDRVFSPATDSRPLALLRSVPLNLWM